MPPAELVGSTDNLDYVLTDTAELNTVLIHLFGQTTLSDGSCLPDAEQGTLYVVVNYGDGASRSPAEEANSIVFGTLARAHQSLRPNEFPAITVSAHDVNGAPGAEALARDVTDGGVAVFRYALVFGVPGGAKGLLTASGPLDRFESLRPTLRRIGAGLRPRRGVQEMRHDMIGAMDAMIVRLRGPIVDQALDACLGGEFTREAATARATAAGFPAFEAEPISRGGEEWFSSAAPADDSARVRLGLLEGPSRMIAGRASLTCAIIGSAPMAALFQQKFAARFPGEGARRLFTVTGGQARPAGGSVVVGPEAGVGSANLDSNETMVAMTIEITPLN